MRVSRSFVGSVGIALLVTAATRAADLPSATPEDLGFSPARLARIGPALTGEIERGQYPGAVVLVARKGKIVYFESYGQLDPASGKPMTKDAIFRLYSMTKPYTSVAAMMLVEEGRLRLTDPVSKYIPAFAKLEVSVASTDPVDRRREVFECPGRSGDHHPGPAPAHLRIRLHGLHLAREGEGALHEGERRLAGPDRRGADRAPGEGAARPSAGHHLRVRPVDRRARPRDRGHHRHAARPVHPGAHLHAAGNDGLGVHRAEGKTRPPGPALRHRSGDEDPDQAAWM